MKTAFILTIVLLSSVKSYSQSEKLNAAVVDSLKHYLEKRLHYPASSLKDYTEGSLIVTFDIDDRKIIENVGFLRHLDKSCDSAVAASLTGYNMVLPLRPGRYTLGFQFYILDDDGKPDSEIKPFDKNRYQNLLFELYVTGTLPTKRVIYH